MACQQIICPARLSLGVSTRKVSRNIQTHLVDLVRQQTLDLIVLDSLTTALACDSHPKGSRKVNQWYPGLPYSVLLRLSFFQLIIACR
jgi:hypothetical protein